MVPVLRSITGCLAKGSSWHRCSISSKRAAADAAVSAPFE